MDDDHHLLHPLAHLPNGNMLYKTPSFGFGLLKFSCKIFLVINWNFKKIQHVFVPTTLIHLKAMAKDSST